MCDPNLLSGPPRGPGLTPGLPRDEELGRSSPGGEEKTCPRVGAW